MIKLKDFSCGYAGCSVLDSINLEIAPGKITVVMGRNGNGKSTFAQVLAGLKSDFRGQVWLDDLKLKRAIPVRSLRQKIGLVLQNPDHQILFNNVQDEIGFALQNLKLPEIPDLPQNKRERNQVVQAERDKIIQTMLKQVGLETKVHADTRELSGGQKQRLALASVLALRPKYLILDEATSMLDLPGRRAIYRILRELKNDGIGIVMLTNSQEEILLADSVLILDQNQIYTYSPTKLIKEHQILVRHGLEVSLLLQTIQNLKADELRDLRTRL